MSLFIRRDATPLTQEDAIISHYGIAALVLLLHLVRSIVKHESRRRYAEQMEILGQASKAKKKRGGSPTCIGNDVHMSVYIAAKYGASG